jgi:hypothetical protein
MPHLYGIGVADDVVGSVLLSAWFGPAKLMAETAPNTSHLGPLSRATRT